MRTLLLVCLLGVAPALSAAEPVNAPVELVKKSTSSDAPLLSGNLAWLVAGAAGAVFSLVLFAMPVLFFALGIAYVAPLVVAVIWAALVMGAASALAWVIMAAFSELRSGILIPVLVGASAGAGITLGAGVVATLVWWMGATVSFFFYPRNFNPFVPDYYYWNPNRPFSMITYMFIGLAWMVWVAGVVTAAVSAPLMGAWVYRRLGIPRRDGTLHFDLMTPGRE